MYSYQDMPNHSRVWIYQSSKEFDEREVNEINFLAEHFADSWASHGNDLKAHISVFHKRFIVVMVDENQAEASGCSIDKSVGFIRDLQTRYDIDLLNRMQVAYWDGDTVNTCRLDGITKLLEHSLISDSTIVFNNMVRDKAEFESKWQVPLRDSWILQYAN